MELEMRIKHEIEENPALEEGEEKDESELDEDEELNDDVETDEEDEFDISDYLDDDADYKTQVNNTSKDEDDKVIPLSGEKSFQERMVDQLQLLSFDETQTAIAATIIGNLDDSGYLNREIEAIVDDLAFSSNVIATEEEVEELSDSLTGDDSIISPNSERPGDDTGDFSSRKSVLPSFTGEGVEMINSLVVGCPSFCWAAVVASDGGGGDVANDDIRKSKSSIEFTDGVCT